MSEHSPGIAILASGSGSTAETFIHATQAGLIAAEVGIVISNNSQAGVFARVDRLNEQYKSDIKKVHISSLTHPGGSGEAGEQTFEEAEAICEEVASREFSLIVFMGYMKKARGSLLELGKPKINTHPGLLPHTRGLFGIHVQEFVIAQGHQYAGQTLHEIDGDYDTGRKLAEHKVPVMSWDTPQTLFEAVQSAEKVHIVADIGKYLTFPGLFNANT